MRENPLAVGAFIAAPPSSGSCSSSRTRCSSVSGARLGAVENVVLRRRQDRAARPARHRAARRGHLRVVDAAVAPDRGPDQRARLPPARPPPRRRPEAVVEPVHARDLGRYVTADYFASLLWTATTSLLPLIVLAIVGRGGERLLLLSWTIAYTLYLLSRNLGMSLVTEGARAPQRLYEFALRTLAQSGKIVVPLALAVALLSPVILRLLGPEYVDGASVLLPLLVLSAIPNVVIATFLERGPGAASDARGRRRHRGDVDQRDGALGAPARPVRARRCRRGVAGRPVRDRDRAAPHRAPGGLAAAASRCTGCPTRVRPQPRGRRRGAGARRGRRVGAGGRAAGRRRPRRDRRPVADRRPARRAAVRPHRDSGRAASAATTPRSQSDRGRARPGGLPPRRAGCSRRGGGRPALDGRDPPPRRRRSRGPWHRTDHDVGRGTARARRSG